jgi:hypothetical protein
MRRIARVRLGAWLLGSLLLGASAAMAQGLPEGTFASSEEGCAKLKDKTTQELGEDLDFYVLTKKGIAAHLQVCDFLEVTARNPTSWLVTAFCDESGYVYPDFFAIAQKENGGLAVTRLTDLTQQQEDSAAEDPAALADDMNPVELDRNPAPAEDDLPPDEDAAAKPDAFNDYVPCNDVKQ